MIHRPTKCYPNRVIFNNAWAEPKGCLRLTATYVMMGVLVALVRKGKGELGWSVREGSEREG